MAATDVKITVSAVKVESTAVNVVDAVAESVVHSDYACPVQTAAEKCGICADTDKSELELRAHKIILKKTQSEHRLKIEQLTLEKKKKELDLQKTKREHNDTLITSAKIKLASLEADLTKQQKASTEEIAKMTAGLDTFMETSTFELNKLHVDRMAEFSAHELKVKAGLVGFGDKKVVIRKKLEADLLAIEESIKIYTISQQAVSNEISVKMQDDVATKKLLNAKLEEEMKAGIANYTTDMATKASEFKISLEQAQNELTVIRAHRIQMDAFFKAKTSVKLVTL